MGKLARFTYISLGLCAAGLAYAGWNAPTWLVADPAQVLPSVNPDIKEFILNKHLAVPLLLGAACGAGLIGVATCERGKEVAAAINEKAINMKWLKSATALTVAGAVGLIGIGLAALSVNPESKPFADMSSTVGPLASLAGVIGVGAAGAIRNCISIVANGERNTFLPK